MPIEIVSVEAVLQQCKSGPLTPVELNALKTVREPYRALLLQPRGVVEASEDRVGAVSGFLCVRRFVELVFD